MTDTPAPGPHLDDDGFLDAVDGAAPPQVEAHLASCTTCAAEVRGLRAVAAAVAAPVPPATPEARDAALAAALAALAPAGTRPMPPSRVDGAAVVDLGSARVGRRRVPPAAWGAIAAAVVALLVAVPVLGSLRGDRGDDQAALRTTSEVLDRSAGSAARDQAAVEDLGPLDSDDQLRSVVGGRLAGITADHDTAGAALVRPTTTVGTAKSQTAPSAAASASPSCNEPLAGQVPPGSTPVYEARLTWKGTPARVLVYRLDARADTVYVVALDDCRLLTFQRIARATP